METNNSVPAEIVVTPNKDSSNSKINFQEFKVFNERGERKYNIGVIMAHLSNRDGKGLVRDVCNIIGEERRDLLEESLNYLGKELFIGLVEKALKIQNEGGIIKTYLGKSVCHDKDGLSSSDKKSTGGILLQLIKKEGGMTIDKIKQIFKKDYKSRNERKKLMKKIEKLTLINEN